MKRLLITFISSILILSGCSSTANKQTPPKEISKTLIQFEEVKDTDTIATISTNMGDIKVKFFPEDAPKAVENFITHAKDGYYDGVIFHRVISDFMIQSGDPEGTGMGGESIWQKPFEDEYSPNLHPFRGALCMANSGTDTNGSQFFIVQNNGLNESSQMYISVLQDQIEADPEFEFDGTDGNMYKLKEVFNENVLNKYNEIGGAIHLDRIFGATHTVFGQVIEGMEVVDAIASVETSQEAETRDKPLTDIVINKITVE